MKIPLWTCAGWPYAPALCSSSVYSNFWVPLEISTEKHTVQLCNQIRISGWSKIDWYTAVGITTFLAGRLYIRLLQDIYFGRFHWKDFSWTWDWCQKFKTVSHATVKQDYVRELCRAVCDQESRLQLKPLDVAKTIKQIRKPGHLQKRPSLFTWLDYPYFWKGFPTKNRNCDRENIFSQATQKVLYKCGR